MANLKKINQTRRWLMHQLTSGISNHSASAWNCNPQEVKSILVSRPNHRLGNLLLITPLLQELENTFPNAKVDIFLKGGLGSIVLRGYKNVNAIMALPKDHFKQLPSYISTWFRLRRKKYDLVINVVPTSSSGRISTKLCRADYKIFGDELVEDGTPTCAHIAQQPILNFRKLVQPSTALNAIPKLCIKLNPQEKEKGKVLLEEQFHPNTDKIIALFTYATGSKCYSKSWWAGFYAHLKQNFPDYFIIEVLPKENVSQIDFEAPTYYSKDIREISGFLANTSLFVGADSGMMHLAVASGVPVVGLFSVTNMDKYQPYGNKNKAINTNSCNHLECIEQIKKILYQ